MLDAPVPAPVDADADVRDTAFFTTAHAAWDAQYEDMRTASRSIYMEQYILMDDGAGLRFLHLLRDKARAGIKVAVVVDGVGSRGLINHPVADDIRAAGGSLDFYNPLHTGRMFLPWRWLPRNHVKTTVIDDRILHTGSVCIWKETRNWHELHIRHTGAAVADAKRHLEHLVDSTRRLPSTCKQNLPMMTPPPRDGRYLVSEPHLAPNPIYRDLMRAIGRAQKSVCIVTPYFLPPWKLRRTLIKLIRKGVTVDVMISRHSDVPIADEVGHSYFPKLLAKGLRIWLYTPSVLHAKYVIVDDAFVSLGSSNIDYLSLLHNREANTVFHDTETSAVLRALFEKKRESCIVATVSFWHEKPIYLKMKAYVGRLFKKVL